MFFTIYSSRYEQSVSIKPIWQHTAIKTNMILLICIKYM